ncbi:MAG TPA: glucose-6-phosphate dehydrogenase [Candidatus Saccharimonadales bacterium]|nr:glucose-6-phosphate dehydrogenase [Candidatus Saccharimonadales bacterium]
MNQEKANDPILVIFGITGDLSKRKLLPALYHLLRTGSISPATKIIGTSRHDLTTDEVVDTFEASILAADKECDPATIELIRNSLRTIKLDPSIDEDYQLLVSLLEKCDEGKKRDRIFYMSVPSTAFGPIIQQLAKVGLNDSRSKILIEKPFGYDVDSAAKLIETINTGFNEEQVYRIDHYLAKETAQNLLAFRMHNPIFKPLWNHEHIRSIHIRALESIGIEGRANFYEQTGALRDLIQSHLMQLLSITLMDLPEDMDSKDIHQAKQVFFEGLLPATTTDALRGQYASYKEEVSNPDSFVETYCRIRLRHSSERWDGVELILETGKGMNEKTTDITIEFRTPGVRRRNNLVFRIQPNEGISLDLIVKEPGLEDKMTHEALDLRYDTVFRDYMHVDAYERVLMDVIRGDQSLFASAAEVMSTWKVLQPLIDAWNQNGEDLKIYASGSKGPHDN